MNRLLIKSLGFSVLAAAIFMTSAAHAYEPAKLKVEVSGVQKDKYFLCLSSVGCVRLDSAQKTMPIDATDVRYIFVANKATYQMYPQALPSSCNVTVDADHTLVVKGNIEKAANNKVYIANLHCAIS